MIGILTGVAALITKAISVITVVAPKILPWIVEGAKLLIKTFGKYLPIVMDTIDSVTDILDIIDRNKVDSEEIGRRSIEADKKPADFDDIQSYIKYLQDEVVLEKKEYSEAEKLAHKGIGGSILISGVEEKLNLNTTPDFWLEVTRNALKTDEVVSILKTYSSKNIPLDFVEYCKGELPYKEEKSRGDMLTEIFSSIYPEKNSNEIEDRVMSLETVTQSEKEIVPYDL